MPESKSGALPLGYIPTCGVSNGSRTHDLQSHNLVCFQLHHILHKFHYIFTIVSLFRSGERESNPPYPVRQRLIRPLLLPLSYLPQVMGDSCVYSMFHNALLSCMKCPIFLSRCPIRTIAEAGVEPAKTSL